MADIATAEVGKKAGRRHVNRNKWPLIKNKAPKETEHPEHFRKDAEAMTDIKWEPEAKKTFDKAGELCIDTVLTETRRLAHPDTRQKNPHPHITSRRIQLACVNLGLNSPARVAAIEAKLGRVEVLGVTAPSTPEAIEGMDDEARAKYEAKDAKGLIFPFPETCYARSSAIYDRAKEVFPVNQVAWSAVVYLGALIDTLLVDLANQAYANTLADGRAMVTDDDVQQVLYVKNEFRVLTQGRLTRSIKLPYMRPLSKGLSNVLGEHRVKHRRQLLAILDETHYGLPNAKFEYTAINHGATVASLLAPEPLLEEEEEEEEEEAPARPLKKTKRVQEAAEEAVTPKKHKQDKGKGKAKAKATASKN